jgi:DNA primase catalytic core
LEAVEYLKKRGISGKTIENFQIGVSSSKYDGLTNFLIEAKAPLDLARDFGLIRASQKQSGDYDVFRERLLFPFIDVRGRVCGFGGRILPSCDKKDAEVKVAKYYNSAESDLFHKSNFLFGLYQAKRAIREEEVVIVVEGNFDVIAMHQHGFENTVATCGTSLTEDHLKTLSRLAKKIIVFFDQDAAGIGATEKAMELGLRNGVLFYGIPYESQLDPDEFLYPDLNDVEKLNAKKMKKWIDAAFPLLDHRIEQELKASEGNVEQRSLAVKKISQWLETFTDGVGRALRVDQLIQKWRIPPTALGNLAQYAGRPVPRAENRQAPSYQQQARTVPAGNRGARRPAFTPYDRQLLHFLVKFEKFGPLFLEAKKQIPEKDSLSAFFDDTELKNWVQVISADPQGFEKLKANPETLLGESISQELQSVIMECLLQQDDQGDDVQLAVLLKKGIHKIWVRFSHELKHLMAAADASQDMEKFKELSQQFLDLQRKLKEFEGSYVSGK